MEPGVGLDEQPPPRLHVGEIDAVALPPVLDTELDEEALAGADPAQDLGDHAVLPVLAECLELGRGQRVRPIDRLATGPVAAPELGDREVKTSV